MSHHDFIDVHLNRIIKQYFCKNGQELPQVRDWTWNASMSGTSRESP